MTEFYTKYDKWFWPVRVADSADKVTVVEDPGGVDEATNETRISTTSSLGQIYYAAGNSDPTGSGPASDLRILSNLEASPLYDELARFLTLNSPNGLSYEFASSTPTGSDLIGSGLTLQHSGSMDLAYDFSSSVSDPLDPRFFGFDREGRDASGTVQDGTTSGTSGSSIASPFSRWGVWQAPKAASDKRLRKEYESFETSPEEPYRSTRFRWTTPRRLREVEYTAVAGAHVFAYDRADKSTEAARAGLPQGDHNNALYDLWRNANFQQDRVIIDHHVGSPDLTISQNLQTVAQLRGEFDEAFAPHDRSDRDYDGERYDLRVAIAGAQPGDYSTGTTPYRH